MGVRRSSFSYRDSFNPKSRTSLGLAILVKCNCKTQKTDFFNLNVLMKYNFLCFLHFNDFRMENGKEGELFAQQSKLY